MFAVLALGTVETLFNRWIDLDAATRQQFDALSGKLLRVVIDSPQLSVDVLFDQNKVRINPTALGMADGKPSLFEQRPYDAAFAPEKAHLTLHVVNLVDLARLMNAKAGATGNIPIQGDMAVLQQLQRILTQAQPDLASQLSPWIGAIPAKQIGDILALGKKTVLQTSQNMANHASEAIIEDSQLFAARWQMDQFKNHVRQLRQDIERAQAKTKALQQQIQTKLDAQKDDRTNSQANDPTNSQTNTQLLKPQTDSQTATTDQSIQSAQQQQQ